MSMLMDQARNRVPRIAEAAVERARLSVVPRRVQKAPKVPFVSLVSLLLVTGVVGLLLFNTSMQQASFTATSLEQRAAVLDANEQALQMEIDTLRDPQKVATRAKQLGMVPRTNPAFIRLPDGKVLGNPTVAQPKDAMQIAPLPTRKPASLRPKPIIVRVAPEADARDTTPRSAVSGAEAGTKKQQREAPGPRRGSER
jgi:cell division protein FtsB